MKNKIIKFTCGIVLGGALALITSQAKVNAMYKPIELDIAADSYIYNPEVGSILNDYKYVLPYNSLYGDATLVDIRIEKERWMTKNGLVPWWDDTYEDFESDIYMTFKFSRHIDTVADLFDNSNEMQKVSSNQMLEYTKEVSETYTETTENVATKTTEGFIKSSIGLGAGASVGIVEANASIGAEFGGRFLTTKTTSESHTYTHYKGETKKYTIYGKIGEFYRWEARATFELYTEYHFKAQHDMVESGRLWNSIYYDITNEGYKLEGIGSYLKMIDNTLYEGVIKYAQSDDGTFYYDDIKQYPEQILYI